ncbi:hypothetical protein M2408_002803 [Sphingobacterium sp. BIGb0165]|nr:hypothetical protein [Sphingobacterium sp. BIGb0165]
MIDFSQNTAYLYQKKKAHLYRDVLPKPIIINMYYFTEKRYRDFV